LRESESGHKKAAGGGRRKSQQFRSPFKHDSFDGLDAAKKEEPQL